MKPSHFAVLGAVAAVVAVLFFLQGGDDPRHQARSESQRSDALDADSAGGAGEKPAGEEAGGGGDLAVTLTVLGPGGEAAAGAELTLRGRTTRNAATDRDGKGGFGGLAPGFYDLHARQGNAVAARSFELEETMDLGTLRLAESVAIRGRVYDSRGVPVAGARVEAVTGDATQRFDLSRMLELWIRPDPVAAVATAGQDGAFELRVQKGGTFVLRVVAFGFAQEGESARAYTSDTVIDFYLFLGATVAGVVVDPEGGPIAGARVMVADTLSFLGRRMAKTEATSDGDGAFALSVTAAGRTALVVRAAGYALHMAQLTFPSTDLRITLERGVVLRLRTVDATDPVPAPGVTVMVNYRGGFATGKTDGRGELVIEHLPTKAGTAMGRQQQAFLAGGGYVPKVVDLATKEPVDGVVEVGEIELTRGGTIRGRVLDAKTRELVAGARVRTFGGVDMQLEFFGLAPSVSDQKGAFELTGVPLGAYVLLGQHPDYVNDFDPTALATGRSGKPLFPGGTTELEKDVLLTPAAAVEGIVANAEGDPVAGATVMAQLGQGQMLMRLVGGNPPEAISDGQGKFVLRGLKAAQATRLVARHREHGSSKAVSVQPGSGEAVTLTLAEPIRLHGKVVGEQGQPLEGVRVTVERKGSARGRSPFSPFDDQGTARPAMTDARGEYLVRNAPVGELVVSIDHQDYLPVKREVSTRPGAPSHEMPETALEHGPGIEGLVVDQEGEPVAEVTVSANSLGGMSFGDDSGGRSWANTSTDSQGHFLLYGLRDGEYNVQPYRLGSFGEQQKVQSGSKGVRLVLRPAGELKGRVTANGRPVVGASVRAERSGRPANEMSRYLGAARTDGSGEFRIAPLPPDGTVTLEIRHDGFATKRVEGLAAGGPARDFVLDRGIRIGGIVVDRAENPVASARLMVRAGGESRSVNTGADGMWIAGGLGDGEITVEVTARSGFVKQDPIPVAPGDMNVRVVVERGESISGSLVGGDDKSLRTVSIEALDENGETAGATWIWGAQRSFELTGLPPGSYTVRASRVREGEWEVLAVAERVASGTAGLELEIE